MTRAKIIDIIKSSLGGAIRLDNKAEYKTAYTIDDLTGKQLVSKDMVLGILPIGPDVFEDVDSALNQPYAAGSEIEKIYIVTQSGSPSLNIGTTNGGGQVLDTTPVGGYMKIRPEQYFAANGNLYFNISGGGSVNIYIFINENII